mgnify:CR=1 FL=1
MIKFDKIWVMWLILVIIWNYCWPSVPPLADVIVAVALSIVVKLINIFNKKKNIKEFLDDRDPFIYK